MAKRIKMTIEQAETKVATLRYDTVKAILRSHKVELWLDDEQIVRRLLAERIETGKIADPTRTDDTVTTTEECR